MGGISESHLSWADKSDYSLLFREGISDAQIRVLKAKLRIMQEELDQLSCEYFKKVRSNLQINNDSTRTVIAPVYQQGGAELQLNSHEPSSDGKRG